MFSQVSVYEQGKWGLPTGGVSTYRGWSALGGLPRGSAYEGVSLGRSAYWGLPTGGSVSRGLGRLPSLHPGGGWAEHPETRKQVERSLLECFLVLIL